MIEITAVAEWRCLSTISVRYEGKDAASHEIDLNQLGQSIQGLARIFALCSNVLLTGELSTRLEAPDVRVVCSPVAEHRCFEVLAMVKSMATSKELWSGAFGAVLAVVVQYVLSRREQGQMKYVNEILFRREQEQAKYFNEILSRREQEQAKYFNEMLSRREQDQANVNESLTHFHDALQVALRNNQATTERVASVADKLVSLIDKLTDILRPAARQALSPIDRSCSRIDLYSEGDRFMTLSSDHKRAFERDDTAISEIAAYVGVISEFDMATGACKVTLDGDTARIAACVIDPVFNQPNNRYVRAMASADPIRFLAKAGLDAESNLIKLYISGSSELETELAVE